MKLLWLLTLAAVLQCATPAKILCILPVAVKSHSILFDRLLNELASRGHDITYLTPFKSNSPNPNITEIITPNFKETARGSMLNPQLLELLAPLMPFLLHLTMAVIPTFTQTEILEVPDVQKLLNRDDFDLILGEPFLDEAIVSGLSYKNKAPIVALCTLLPNTYSHYVVGNPAPSSYIPSAFLAFNSEMTLFQRVYNFFLNLFGDVAHSISLFFEDRLMRRYFGDDLPYISSIIKNTSLLLVNHHPSLSFSRPQTPNTIDVAGMHIYPPKPLPKDLEEYMSKSKNGVILFSLGSQINSSDLTETRIQSILRALRRLDLNVIWKFEKELNNVPENVMISKWLPQSDILAHPNLKLFITHGGMLSTTEAMHRGVPVVGIPIMVDQPVNMKHTENAGFGLTIPLNELTEEKLYQTVQEVLNNPKYREAAQYRSRLLRDGLKSPLENAVWWIEYVLRHNGAPHLRSASQDLYWFQLHQLDTGLTLLVILFVFVYCNVWVAKKVVKRVFKGKCSKSDQKKKNN